MKFIATFVGRATRQVPQRAMPVRPRRYARMATATLLLACSALLAACASERVTATDIRPRAELASGLPLPGSVLVRIAPHTREQRSFAQFSRVRSQSFHVGRELQDAALLVARSYFRDAALLTPEGRTHYVLSIDETEAEPGAIANNEVKLLATLYATDGHVMYRAVTTAATPQFGGEDRATYFNTYVDAVRKFLDAAVLAKRGEMELDLASRAPAMLAFAHEDGDSPRRIAMAGTGFRVSPSGIVATARHAAQDCLGMVIVQGRDLLPLHVLASDPASGVLLLQAQDAEPTRIVAVTQTDNPLPLGAPVTVLDYNRSVRIDATVQRIAGTVRTASRMEDDPRRVLLDLPLPAGSRGGPAFDEAGRFVGIVLNSVDVAADAGPTAKPTDRLHAAIPAAALRRLLDAYSAGGETDAPTVTSAAAATAEDTAAAVVQLACVE